MRYWENNNGYCLSTHTLFAYWLKKTSNSHGYDRVSGTLSRNLKGSNRSHRNWQSRHTMDAIGQFSTKHRY